MSYMMIGVHGLANKPPKELHTQAWIAAIREGLERNCSSNPKELSFEMAYWADQHYAKPLDPDDEPYIPTPPDKPIKKYRDNWLDEFRAHTANVGGNVIEKAREWFGFGPASGAIMESKLADLDKYYDEKNDRTFLRAIVKNAVRRNKDRRITVIAHSMGSIISYDALRELGNEDMSCKVQNFITIGSPLGLPTVAAHIHNEWGNLRTPSIVGKWVNLADPRDPVALDIHLNDDYEPNDAGVRVQDDLILNNYADPKGKRNFHKIYGYLRCPEMSELIRGVM